MCQIGTSLFLEKHWHLIETSSQVLGVMFTRSPKVFPFRALWLPEVNLITPSYLSFVTQRCAKNQAAEENEAKGNKKEVPGVFCTLDIV